MRHLLLLMALIGAMQAAETVLETKSVNIRANGGSLWLSRFSDRPDANVQSSIIVDARSIETVESSESTAVGAQTKCVLVTLRDLVEGPKERVVNRVIRIHVQWTDDINQIMEFIWQQKTAVTK
jgi:hypothetical protein